MAEFKRDNVETFLGVVRKYMQMRGAMSQKDLAEVTDVGVSTMSRFLSQKSTEMNPQLIAKITAKLNIPLHEMIDFVEEDFNDRFVRLVKFYKN
jgi:transcriptional regulator with XRE-family HTH domain